MTQRVQDNALSIANEELIFQNDQKEKRAAELIIANKELAFQNGEKEKRAAELIIANKELAFQNDQKEKRAAELIIANKELAFQNGEKEKRAAELIIANKELAFQNDQKEKRAAELIIANKELIFQNEEKEKRAAELIIANKELIYQNEEKEKRAAELIIANAELAFQNEEKEKRAAELIIANKELAFQNEEKEKRAAELTNANRLYTFISQINQTIVKVDNEELLFENACRIAVENGKFELALVTISDAINKKLKIVAHCNAMAGDLNYFNHLIYDNNGPTANVLQSGQPYVINDYEQENAIGSSKKYASERGFKSCILLPIKKSGETIAVYNLFSTRRNLFDGQEIALLDEATRDISFALDVFENEKSRKKMEARVIHSELQLKQAQAIAHFGSWEMDLSTGIVEWSEEACRIYGLSCKDNTQSYQSWMSFIHPDDLDEVMMVTREGALTLNNTAIHHRIIRKDGIIRHIFSQTQYKFNHKGEPFLLNCVTHDITEMKEAEAERTKLMADIVKRNKNLEQFSYAVSHNLRAPVANILGIADVMQTIGLDKQDEKTMLGYLASAVKKLDTVVIDLNEVLKVKHEVSEQKTIISFSGLLSNVILSIDNIIKKEHVRIIANFSEIDEITTLKSYLQSIFFNLVSNSIKYRQQGIAPVIEISTAKLKNKILLVFKDNGLGIDLEKRGDDVFGIYKRFHNHVEGKGLGLYMVKTQVETLGGTISVASEVNKGTEFRIEFEVNE